MPICDGCTFGLTPIEELRMKRSTRLGSIRWADSQAMSPRVASNGPRWRLRIGSPTARGGALFLAPEAALSTDRASLGITNDRIARGRPFALG
jgi:hypothetical protein